MRIFSLVAKEVREFDGVKRAYAAEKIIDPNLIVSDPSQEVLADYFTQSIRDLGSELNHEISKYETTDGH